MACSDQLPALITVDDLADRLGVTARHVRRLVAERRIPFLKVGWFVRFDTEEIAAWLDENRRPSLTRCPGDPDTGRG